MQNVVPLAQILKTTLPAPEYTAMLRSCLHQGDRAQQAWKIWSSRYGGLRRMLDGRSAAVKRLLPLLSFNQAKNRIKIDSDLQTVLRTAQLREKARNPVFRQACSSAFKALTSGGAPFVVLKGTALADTVYEEPSLRHCHDCDLFVKRLDFDNAKESLLDCGFTELKVMNSRRNDSVSLAHPNGLPINLHSRLLRFPAYEIDEKSVWGRTEPRLICGENVLILSPSDALLHVCVHSTTTYSRDFLCWVCDSWMLIEKNESIDWRKLCDDAKNGGLGLPAYLTFNYLANELEAPIPVSTARQLEVCASKVSRALQETALFGVVAGPRGSIIEIIRGIRNVADALILSKWILIPSPRHMRWKYAIAWNWLLPLYYLLRPLRAIAFRIFQSRRQQPGVHITGERI